MESTPDVKLPAVRQPSGLQAALKRRADDYLRAAVMLITPTEELEAMNLIELQKLSTMELRDIYNGLADKQVKRFADRVEAEKRTAQKLREAGTWTGDMPDGKTVAAAKSAKGSKAAEKAPVKAAPTKPSKASKGAPAPKTGKAVKSAEKAPAKAASKAPRQPVAGRGAPRGNPAYRVLKANAKMNAGSARTKVFLFIKEAGKGKAGIDRESIENNFVNDETVNVKSSIDYLLKVEIIEPVEV